MYFQKYENYRPKDYPSHSNMHGAIVVFNERSATTYYIWIYESSVSNFESVVGVKFLSYSSEYITILEQPLFSKSLHSLSQ